MNKSNLLYCLAFVLLCGGFSFCLSETEKYGVLTGNERWTAEKSPYVITDDLLIPHSVSLVIMPGVTVLVSKPVSFISGIPQIDHTDSFTVSIQVKGALSCRGKPEKRILFTAYSPGSIGSQWYGIYIDSTCFGKNEFYNCDISNACNGIVTTQVEPSIRNSVFEYNNAGIVCLNKSRPKIYNCIIAHNLTAGIRVVQANPEIMNCIITRNAINGIWSDNLSLITLAYNCFYGNTDANFSGCNPEYGVLKKKNKNKDSTDFTNNICLDPIFAGSSSDSVAAEHDVSMKTDRSRIKDTALAKILVDTLTDSSVQHKIARPHSRYALSSYSPCINAGNPDKEFNDADGSVNDMGIYGGLETDQKSGKHKK